MYIFCFAIIKDYFWFLIDNRVVIDEDAVLSSDFIQLE